MEQKKPHSLIRDVLTGSGSMGLVAAATAWGVLVELDFHDMPYSNLTGGKLGHKIILGSALAGAAVGALGGALMNYREKAGQNTRWTTRLESTTSLNTQERA